jgi:hypothetical protein
MQWAINKLATIGSAIESAIESTIESTIGVLDHPLVKLPYVCIARPVPYVSAPPADR